MKIVKEGNIFIGNGRDERKRMGRQQEEGAWKALRAVDGGRKYFTTTQRSTDASCLQEEGGWQAMREPQLNGTVPVVNDDNHPDINAGGRGGRGRRCRAARAGVRRRGKWWLGGEVVEGGMRGGEGRA